jgi:glycosyltransferase involved in cell wall biosynthesis
MRVLHVIPSISPVRGGPSQAVIEMVSALCQAGIDAEILTTNDHGENLLNVELHQRIIYKGAPTWIFPRYSPSIHPIREFAFSQSFTIWLWRHISEYDLVHIHAIFSYPSTVAMTIARMQNVTYIVRPLGQLCNWSLQQSPQKKYIYLRLIERSNLENACALHVTSCQEQSELNELKINCSNFVIPHGLQVSSLLTNASQRLREHFQLPLDERVVLFLSRLHPKKGLEYLIQSLASLSDQRFTLIIAGHGDKLYEKHIHQFLEEHNLQDKTILTGFVEGELKQLLLQGADLFALTSHSENFGIAVLEALAAGTPVLITPSVALATEVEQYGLGYVVSQEITAIANALIKHWQLPDQQKEILRQKAYKFVLDNYAWDTIANNLVNVYQKVIR